jgi:hypothetical protein
MKVRRNFFSWFSNEYHFRVKHKKVAVWNGTKYSWSERHKSQYRHYWISMWGHDENDQRKSLLAAADCIERIGRMDPDLSFGDGVSSIRTR